MENYKTVSTKVVTAQSLTRGSSHWALTRNRWLPMGAGRFREVVAYGGWTVLSIQLGSEAFLKLWTRWFFP